MARPGGGGRKAGGRGLEEEVEAAAAWICCIAGRRRRGGGAVAQRRERGEGARGRTGVGGGRREAVSRVREGGVGRWGGICGLWPARFRVWDMGFVFLCGLNTYSCRAGRAHVPEAQPRHGTMPVPGRPGHA